MSTFKSYQDGILPDHSVRDTLTDPKKYFMPKNLQGAVDAAIQLNLPLFVTGEPGTGKTQLAHHLADRFGLGKALIFNAQTTSQARDLFYRYDALAHFQFAQIQKDQALHPDLVEREFIRYEGLGRAIKDNLKSVVLLDEIDKAPRDFPNDILAAIENLSFSVPEIGKSYPADPSVPQQRKLVIMTSNSEKNLPDAFLRRVAYCHIPFPEKADLVHIVLDKMGGDKAQIEALVGHFLQIRDEKLIKMRKKPATAELLNWALLLQMAHFPLSELADPADLSAKNQEVLKQSYSVLAKNRDDLAELTKKFKMFGG